MYWMLRPGLFEFFSLENYQPPHSYSGTSLGMLKWTISCPVGSLSSSYAQIAAHSFSSSFCTERLSVREESGWIRGSISMSLSTCSASSFPMSRSRECFLPVGLLRVTPIRFYVYLILLLSWTSASFPFIATHVHANASWAEQGGLPPTTRIFGKIK